MNSDYEYRNLPLKPLMIQELIRELFAGRGRTKKEEIVNEVNNTIFLPWHGRCLLISLGTTDTDFCDFNWTFVRKVMSGVGNPEPLNMRVGRNAKLMFS